MSGRRTLAVYGKGGIGKTTVASTLSVLFARAGARVLLVGCDPKHDTTYKLVPREEVRTVMDLLAASEGKMPSREAFLMRGRFGIDCVETGGPKPGVGCAGRGITRMFDVLAASRVLESDYDVVVYDVLGDVVCGGFAAPIRRGHAREVYIVASGEVMAMYAANNIAGAVANNRRAGVAVGGLVANLRGVAHETLILERFAAAIGVRLLPPIPRDETLQQAERQGQTVVEYAPTSPVAAHYEALFAQVAKLGPADAAVPAPLDDRAFDDFVRSQPGPGEAVPAPVAGGS